MKQKITFVLLLLLSLMFPGKMFSQEAIVADSNEVLFNNYDKYITPFKSASFETILEQTARYFLGTPYVAGTLDVNKKEQLVINLEELDCVTYVENVMALSYAVFSKDLSFDTFKKWLQNIRYRNGGLFDYASRLHYTSDWVFDNQSMGLLKNISQQLSSGVRKTTEINFMSTHSNAYKQLAHDDEVLEEIKQTEKNINSREGFYYLAKHNIAVKAVEIPHMAVVGIVTSTDGLDASHIGFAYQKDGELQFIHASSTINKVIIDSKTLSNYCLSQKRCKGIIVAKVLPQ